MGRVPVLPPSGEATSLVTHAGTEYWLVVTRIAVKLRVEVYTDGEGGPACSRTDIINQRVEVLLTKVATVGDEEHSTPTLHLQTTTQKGSEDNTCNPFSHGGMRR